MTRVMTVVDRLTKMAHFVAFPGPPSAPDMADALVREVVWLHGLPDDKGDATDG